MSGIIVQKYQRLLLISHHVSFLQIFKGIISTRIPNIDRERVPSYCIIVLKRGATRALVLTFLCQIVDLFFYNFRGFHVQKTRNITNVFHPCDVKMPLTIR